MKKRIISWLLVLCISFTLMSFMSNSAFAVDTLSSTPNAKIDYSYSSGVSTGTIRYMSQITSSSYFYSSYWGDWVTKRISGVYYGPGSECGTCSISMALSYIGINRTPKDLLDAGSGVTYFGSSWGGAEHSSPSLSTAISNYVNGQGKYSPVIVHLPTYTSEGHYVLLAGKVSSNQFHVVDPARNAVGTMTINGTSWSYNGKSGNIDQVHQYYNANASIIPINTAPGKPALKDFPTAYVSGETTVFNWNATENTTHYNLYIDKQNSDGSWQTDYKVWHYANSGQSVGLEDGTYRVLLQSTNSNASGWPYTNGDYIKFTIGETRGTKVTFNPQGGSFGSAKYSCSINGINRDRGSGETIIYTRMPDTNSYGVEIAADSYGRVQAVRRYGNTEQMTVPSGGFVLSAHAASGNAGVKLAENAALGDYIGYDLSPGTAYNYGTDDSAYLANHLYMTSDYNYGSLPVPTRDGYYFDGWYDSASGGNRINYGTPVSTYTLYAHWTPVQGAAPIASTELNGNRYELFDYNMSWSEAKAFCEARGGHLVTITDSTEQREVLKLIKKGNNNLYFLGCSDAEKEGTWKWVTGESFSYENWDKDGPEPSNNDGENYAMILNRDYGKYKNTGDWVDGKDKEPVIWFYSYSNTGFVCEYDADIKITFDLQGGSYPTQQDRELANTKKVLADSTYGNLPVPVKEGYVFGGWGLNSTTGDRVYADTKYSSSTLVAKWLNPSEASWSIQRKDNGHQYELYEYNLTWKEAQEFCEARGGHLVVITSKEELSTVSSMVSIGDNYIYWIGCSDEQNEGKWTWVNGESFSYTNWDPQYPEPDTAEGYDFGGIVNKTIAPNKQHGEWLSNYNRPNEMSGKYWLSNYGFICEYDTIPHVHSMTAVAKAPATCTKDGTEAYWKCSGCGKLFSDAQGKNEISAPVVIKATGHEWDSGKVTKAATCTEAGVRTFTCKHDSSHTRTETIQALGHDYKAVVTAPTCTERGYTTHTCSRCGDSYLDSYVATKGHSWDNGKVTKQPTETAEGVKTFTCTVCGETRTESIPKLTHTHKLTAVTKVAATCTKDGTEAYWKCSGCGKMFSDAQGKNEISAPVVIKATGHSWDSGKVTKAATCTEAGVRTFTCKHDSSHTRTEAIPALGHDYKAVVTAPTCTEKGYTTHTCSRCGDSYVDSYVNALGHKTELRNTKAATCTTDGYTGDEICSICGETIRKGTVIKASGHKWDSGKVTKEPTETAEGVKTFTCIVCGETKTEAIPKLTHKHNYTDVVTPPTCTEQGYTTHTCAGCGESYVDSYVDALGHKTELRNAKAATCTADGYTGDEICPVCGATVKQGIVIKTTGHKWDSGKVTKEPTETAEGVKTFTCTVCGETRTEAIPKLTPVTPPAPNNPFVDVKQGAYYYDPVLWAVNHQPQITNGTSATTFSPDATCTRGQVVTFLWRANGCPEPNSTSNPFKDVASGAYYYKAVLWAVENEITNGTSSTTFSPDAPCTRAHVVTFLWRSANKPAAGSANPFNDVAAGQYYTDAVLWAVSKNITNGTSATTFSPDSPCTRGQIVTFLYRYLK